MLQKDAGEWEIKRYVISHLGMVYLGDSCGCLDRGHRDKPADADLDVYF